MSVGQWMYQLLYFIALRFVWFSLVSSAVWHIRDKVMRIYYLPSITSQVKHIGNTLGMTHDKCINIPNIKIYINQ